MRFAYADPPYPGMAHLYKDHPDYAGEVDHKALIERLVTEFPDGWALSTASSTVKEVQAACPEGVRVCVWMRSDANFHPQQLLRYTWQPLILKRGRNVPPRVDDVLAFPRGQQAVLGGKPESYCFWLFRCLGALPGDELVDLFPGSGAVSRAWEKYQRQMTLPMPREKVPQLKLEVPR